MNETFKQNVFAMGEVKEQNNEEEGGKKKKKLEDKRNPKIGFFQMKRK